MINLFFQCQKCMEELPPNTSPEEYGMLAVGLTPHNECLQVWCQRHDCNVVQMPLSDEQKEKFIDHNCEVCGCQDPPHQH